MKPEEILFHLLVDLVIIIVAARTLGWLVTRIGQPAVVGEILAGILLGPSVLGQIAHSAPRTIFPPEVPLKSIADIGLVFFMFLVGLELDPKLMRAQGRRAIQISLSGIFLPLLLGVGLGILLVSVNNGGTFQPDAPHPPKTLTFALFTGAALCVTAFPVLARILVDSGLYKTVVGTATLCAAAVDDAIAWILLAAVIGIAVKGSPVSAIPTFIEALIFVGFMVVVGRRLLEVLARRYDAAGRLTVDQVAVILAGVLLSAAITQRIGIAEIFGAFIFGAIMPKRSGMTQELTDKIEDFAVIVLLPVFFAVAGLRTNLFALNSVSLVGWLFVLLAAATIGKFAGCGIAARLTGSSGADAAVIGALMNARGLTQLVIVTIGLNLGVLSDRTFAMMVVMALLTTVLAAPIVNHFYPRERVARELAEAQGLPSVVEAVAVRILVALGNPANAGALVDAAIRLTGSLRPAELIFVRLIPTPRAPEFRTGLQDEESQVSAAVESMRRLVDQAETAGVMARPISFLSPDVGQDLVRVATDQQCDTILLGWHRASLPRHVIEALVHRTFMLASCTVAVFVDRQGLGVQPEPDRPVMVALTGGRHDEAATKLATHLAENLHASLRLVGYVGAQHDADGRTASEELALRADGLRQSSGHWVVPEFVEGNALGLAVEETGKASVAVVGVADDWADQPEFGYPASELAKETHCPTFVIRAAGQGGAQGKGFWQRRRRSQREPALATRE